MGEPIRVFIAGGGTGGHLYPGIAIAQEIRRQNPEAVVAFIGNKKRIEGRVVPEHGYPFHPIVVAGFLRSFSPGTVIAAGKLLVGLVQSYRLLRRERPDVVVGTGGYVCGPPVYVAARLGIPTLIQEQNSIPGVTTRLLAGRVTEVHLSFEESRGRLSRTEGVFVTGNPTRGTIGTISREDGAAAFGLDPRTTIALVAGGSRGARSINRAILETAGEIAKLPCQILWATGTEEFAAAREALAQKPEEVQKMIRAVPYIESMDRAYAAADIAVCRAGATTIAELTRAGCPAILVPYPFAAADHQTGNARTVADAGAAVLVRDDELGARLLPELRELAENPARRAAMRACAGSLAKPRAAETLASAVIRLARHAGESSVHDV